MKNRKTVVAAFLMAAVMLLGVGYAALTDTLTLIGNATIDFEQAGINFDHKVYWSAGEVVSSPNAEDDNVGGINTDDATFVLHSLATKGDKAVLKFTIKNESNVPVIITVNEPSITGPGADKFDCDYDYSLQDKTIPSGGTMDVTVTVTVSEAVTTQLTATFSISYNVTTVEATAE